MKVTTWLVAEIILNLIGLDNLADYGEFVFDKEVFISTSHHQVSRVFPPRHSEGLF
ncbi:hypothetical protein [Moorena sp. SIO4G3]|uniref:hypothetical protein n=1 Tax=Moorena sp. SIO4G3 TaxID=2607821 RepID=UPI0025EF3DF0|nr:hypothetical protein [Moorena sp. SIO4G3]